MNCREAHKLMDEVLDGNPTHQARLESHLAECEQCRAQWAVLSRTQDALIQCVGRPVEDAALERLTHSVLTEVAARGTDAEVVTAPRRWVAFAVAAGLLLAFASGLGAGRALWPREVPITKIATRVVNRPFMVEVPVPEKRVVVKHVPVVKTRIVYRDRPPVRAEAAEGELSPGIRGAPEASAPPKVELVALQPVLRREIQPAAVVDDGATDVERPEPLAGGHADVAVDRSLQTMMVAQTDPGITQPTVREDQ